MGTLISDYRLEHVTRINHTVLANNNSFDGISVNCKTRKTTVVPHNIELEQACGSNHDQSFC